MAISAKLLNDGESVVVSTRTHPKALIMPVIVLLLALAAAVYVRSLIDGTSISALTWASVVWMLATAAILWFTVRPVLDWLFTTYTFTTRRFIKRSGVIAREGRTIPLNRISGVDFEQGVIDRMLGCGTLVVTDASAEGRVELKDVPSVEKVQLKVAEQLHRLGQPGGNESPESRHDDGA